jgi:hypothetical protein
MIVVWLVTWWHKFKLQNQLTSECNVCGGNGYVAVYGFYHPEYEACECRVVHKLFLDMPENKEIYEY